MGANRQPVLGHIDCPVCDFPEMQIKHDKNGDASGYCPDCSQQLFTRNPHKSALLLKRMRPVKIGRLLTDQAQPEPVAVPVTVDKAPPARQDGAQGAKPAPARETPAPVVKTSPKPAKAVEEPKPAPSAGGWWAPVIGKTARKGQQNAV